MLRRDIVYQAAVINSATDGCLDSNGTGQVYTGTCNGGDFQQWRFNATGTIIDLATGRCLDNNSVAQVYTSTCNGGSYQTWIIDPPA